MAESAWDGDSHWAATKIIVCPAVNWPGPVVGAAPRRAGTSGSQCTLERAPQSCFIDESLAMDVSARLVAASEILPLRTKFREEANCQITKDSIHRREGWTQTYLLELGGRAAGFGAMAIAGPWQGRPTIFEFYVLQEYRGRLFDLFDALLAATDARYLEVQTNEPCLPIMLHVHGSNVASESIVFADRLTTTLPSNGTVFRRTTSDEETRRCIEERGGGSEAVLEIEGATVARGGILFHYNRPYGDIHMEVAEPFRRRGLGAYLVQELKRVSYEFGAVPAARCNTNNVPSRRTLQRAGFVPCAHILVGAIASVRGPSA